MFSPWIGGEFLLFCETVGASIARLWLLQNKSHAAYGGSPHQSSIGSEEPMDDSFSPGRSLCPVSNAFPLYATRLTLLPMASPLRVVLRAANHKSNDCRGQSHLNSKQSWTRLFGTESMTDVGDLPPLAAGGRPRVAPTIRFWYDERSRLWLTCLIISSGGGT